MEAFRDKFLVVDFVTSDGTDYTEAIPWKWYKNNKVYWPVLTKLEKKRSYVDHEPDYDDLNAWEPCDLKENAEKSIKGVFLFFSEATQRANILENMDTGDELTNTVKLSSHRQTLKQPSSLPQPTKYDEMLKSVDMHQVLKTQNQRDASKPI